MLGPTRSVTVMKKQKGTQKGREVVTLKMFFCSVHFNTITLKRKTEAQ